MYIWIVSATVNDIHLNDKLHLLILILLPLLYVHLILLTEVRHCLNSSEAPHSVNYLQVLQPSLTKLLADHRSYHELSGNLCYF